MINVMVDLETLGTTPGSKLLSIGAVVFDVDAGLGAEFYTRIVRDGQWGLTEEQSPVDWWTEQSEEARYAAFEAPGAVPLPTALEDFSAWLSAQGTNVCIWGNGASFDNALLAAAYAACGIPLPWKYWNDRCCRTLKNLFPRIELTRFGTHHHTLEDAKTQARHAIYLLRYIRSLE